VLSHVELPRDSLIGSTAPHRHISMPLNPAHRGPGAKVTANIRDPHCHQNQDHRIDLQIRSTSEAAMGFQESQPTSYSWGARCCAASRIAALVTLRHLSSVLSWTMESGPYGVPDFPSSWIYVHMTVGESGPMASPRIDRGSWKNGVVNAERGCIYR
jgi:hypothetical protein